MRDAVIETIAEALRAEPAVRALYLTGSYGAGIEDEHSDLDFVAVIAGDAASFTARWREAVGRTGEIVLWWDQTAHQLQIMAITADWSRFDVVYLTREQMAKRAQKNMRVVFDHDDIFASLPPSLPKPVPNPAQVRTQFESFLRVLGLLSLAIDREDYLVGVTGVFHLRTILTDLLVDETGVSPRGGALNLKRQLTTEQKALLEGLPIPAPTRDSVIAANLAIAAAYLPRARARAAALGVEWPERFEAATWAHLGRWLGVARPY
ncbi:MAG: hypothetical protein AB7O56_07045 [Bauldia sp.]